MIYFTQHLVEGADDPLWGLLRTEWATESLKEVILAARSDRLSWLPAKVLRGIDRLTVERILWSCQPSVIQEAKAVLEFIGTAYWSRCPHHQRSLPEIAKRFSPVFERTGDWFEFDPKAWRPVNLPVRSVGEEVKDDADVRGPRLYGSTANHPTWDHRGGYSRGRDASYPTAHQRATGECARMIERAKIRQRLSVSGRGAPFERPADEGDASRDVERAETDAAKRADTGAAVRAMKDAAELPDGETSEASTTSGRSAPRECHP